MIAITMGDPYGIGPEIILKSLADDEIKKLAGFLVFGSRGAMEWSADRLGITWSVKVIKSAEDAPDGGIAILDDGRFRWERSSVGKVTPEGGEASARWITEAAKVCLSGKCDAMVTAPISKEALWTSGNQFAGHTELLAHLTRSSRAVMMLIGGGLRVALVTTHTSLKRVPALISKGSVLNALITVHAGLSGLMGIEHPKISVCALNPHAGEGGLFGDEETREIAPAIEEARKRGIDCLGPFPADTLFHAAWKGQFDVVVAMYHDQGLVPLKLLAFETGVNVTLAFP